MEASAEDCDASLAQKASVQAAQMQVKGR